MKARVTVMLKNGVLDPQGEAVRHALGSLGFDGVEGVRQGKVIELDLAPGTTEDTVVQSSTRRSMNIVASGRSIFTHQDMGARAWTQICLAL